jgi:hypothetical protein
VLPLTGADGVFCAVIAPTDRDQLMWTLLTCTPEIRVASTASTTVRGLYELAAVRASSVRCGPLLRTVPSPSNSPHAEANSASLIAADATSGVGLMSVEDELPE